MITRPPVMPRLVPITRTFPLLHSPPSARHLPAHDDRRKREPTISAGLCHLFHGVRMSVSRPARSLYTVPFDSGPATDIRPKLTHFYPILYRYDTSGLNVAQSYTYMH